MCFKLQINQICFADCELSRRFLSIVINEKWTMGQMYQLEFHCCRLGNTMADKISHPFYHNITYLEITSDPIGNKGIKKLVYL